MVGSWKARRPTPATIDAAKKNGIEVPNCWKTAVESNGATTRAPPANDCATPMVVPRVAGSEAFEIIAVVHGKIRAVPIGISAANF